MSATRQNGDSGTPPGDAMQERIAREESRRIPRDQLLMGAIFLALAAVLRLVFISQREIFGNEYFTIAFMSEAQPRARSEPILSIMYGQLPLYYEMIRLWGQFTDTSSEWLLRLPSALFGLLACGAFFMFARRYLRGIAFAVCLAGFTLNPTLIAVSDQTNSFALLSLWVVLSNYYCIRALDEDGRRNWVFYGIFSALGAVTHPLFWFVLLSQFVFAVARPRKTPHPYLLFSLAGIFICILMMISAAIYAEQYLPRKVDVQAPAIDDLARGLVAVTLGNFPRYGSREFVTAVMYLFLIVALILGYFYYRMRAKEAAALPDNIVWVDETHDVVGNWKRLSLASFLAYQWAAFGVPALCIMMLGSFSPDVRLHPEYFIVCLPPLLILVAAGIDAAPGVIGKGVMIVIFAAFMVCYNYLGLTDPGYGVRIAFDRLKQEEFNPQKDALLFINYSGLEKPVERYSGGVKFTEFNKQMRIEDTASRLDQVTSGTDQVFVFYHDDSRRIGKDIRSPAREWFAMSKFKHDSKWDLSQAAKTELRVYKRMQ
ncbi:MAG: glycosyltransferase family 39 protein [bacterium]|nr:glycosyltransferase family 39 protein [Candidatus Sumerlaeota bacterium]